eukprot:403336623
MYSPFNRAKSSNNIRSQQSHDMFYSPIYEQDDEQASNISFRNNGKFPPNHNMQNIIAESKMFGDSQQDLFDEYHEFMRPEEFAQFQAQHEQQYQIQVRKANPETFKRLYEQAMMHQQRRMMMGGGSEFGGGSSAESGSNFIRNESEEDKFSYRPQINAKSRELVEQVQQRNIAEQNKPKYVFDSLYQDYYVKKQENEQKLQQMDLERKQLSNSKGKQNMKSIAINYHRAIKDLKGILYLFKSKENTITLKDFTNIFYHLSTFNHNLNERYQLQGAMPPQRMKLEIKFEEELWFQFCLSSKDKLPMEVLYEVLKILYIKTPDQILSHKIQEFSQIIESYRNLVYREREKVLIQKSYDPQYLKYKQATPKEILNDFIQLNFTLGSYKIKDLYSKKNLNEMQQRINDATFRPDISLSQKRSKSFSKTIKNISSPYRSPNRDPKIQQIEYNDQSRIPNRPHQNRFSQPNKLYDMDFNNSQVYDKLRDDSEDNEQIEDEGSSRWKDISQNTTMMDLKTINNLKLNKRRTKDFYEENRKKPALFTVNSALINNQNFKETSILKPQAYDKEANSRSPSKTKTFQQQALKTIQVTIPVTKNSRQTSLAKQKSANTIVHKRDNNNGIEDEEKVSHTMQIQDSVKLRRLNESVERDQGNFKSSNKFNQHENNPFKRQIKSGNESGGFRSPVQNHGRLSEVTQESTGNNKSNNLSSHSKGHRFVYSKDENDTVLFYFDLQLDKNRVKQIAVRRGDSPRTLIDENCKEEKNINYQAMRKLEEFLTIKIKEHSKQ